MLSAQVRHCKTFAVIFSYAMRIDVRVGDRGNVSLSHVVLVDYTIQYTYGKEYKHHFPLLLSGWYMELKSLYSASGVYHSTLRCQAGLWGT